MNRIEIGVADPKAEQDYLLKWAARVDQGESLPESIPAIHFSSEQQLQAVFTGQRLDLLRFVARNEGLSYPQIAQGMGRDCEAIRADVRSLTDLGLLEERYGRLFAPYDDIVIHYVLREAA